jgi:hypothetical protein
MHDYIKVDCRDIYSISFEQINALPEKPTILYSSAAVNDLFYLRMIQVAIRCKFLYLMVSEDYLEYYLGLKLFVRINQIGVSSPFAEAYVMANEGAEAEKTSRNVICININETKVSDQIGLNFFLMIFFINYIYNLETIELEMKNVINALIRKSFGKLSKTKYLNKHKVWGDSAPFCMTWIRHFHNLIDGDDSSKNRWIKNFMPNNRLNIYFDALKELNIPPFEVVGFKTLKEKYLSDSKQIQEKTKFCSFFSDIVQHFTDKLVENNYYIL